MSQENGKKNGTVRKAKNVAITKKNAAVTKNSRIKLAVGKPWTEKIEVHDASARKDRVNVLFAWAFLVLLFALTAHAMVTHNQPTLNETLSIDKMGLACVAVWAGGKAILKVLSGWHEDEK